MEKESAVLLYFFWTDVSGQTVQTQIRATVWTCLHRLQYCLHILEECFHGRISFKVLECTITAAFWGVHYFGPML